MKFLLCLTSIILFFGRIDVIHGSCSRGEFQCNNNKCVQAPFFCDGDNDCGDQSDEEGCLTELLENNFLITADSLRKNLFQIGLDDDVMVPILPSKGSNPFAVAFDEINGDVYWTDIVQRKIGRYSIINPTRTTLTVKVFDATAVLDGLAIDAAQQDLYYCDAGDAGKIGVIKTDGQRNRELIREVDMKPRAIVLDLNNRVMYWTDWGNQSSINRASMDTGEDRVVLVSEHVGWPNALAIDFSRGEMYWGDAQRHVIEYARLDGTERAVLTRSLLDHYFAFALTPDFIYFTDWTERTVRKLNRRSLAVSDQPPIAFGRLAGLIYVARSHINGSYPTVRITTRSTTTKMPIPSTTTTTILPPTAIKMDQSSTTVPSSASGGHFSETTLIIIVCIGVGGLVLVSSICSLVICAVKKRSRSSSMRMATTNAEQQQLANMTLAMPTVQMHPSTQTVAYSKSGALETYDYIRDDHIYYHEPRTSSSEDYMKPTYGDGRQQQPLPQPGYQYDKIINMRKL